jgi:hypothetical protein
MLLGKEEDVYFHQGKKPFISGDLCPPEDEMILGPPIVDNDDLCR